MNRITGFVNDIVVTNIGVIYISAMDTVSGQTTGIILPPKRNF